MNVLFLILLGSSVAIATYAWGGTFIGEWLTKLRVAQLARSSADRALPELQRLRPALSLQRWFPVWTRSTELLLYRSGVRMETGRFLMVVAGSAVVVEMLFGAMGFGFGGAIIGLIVGGVAPFLFLRQMAVGRSNQFGKHFPDALDMIVGSLRAGLPLHAAFELVGQESASPVREEFHALSEEISFGIPLRDALETLAVRVDTSDCRFFVVAVLLQRETGGDLIRLLEEAAKLIRERSAVLGDVRVQTAQSRASATVLLALPLLLTAFMMFAVPGHLDPLTQSTIGRMILTGCVLMQLLGAYAIHRIMEVRV